MRYLLAAFVALSWSVLVSSAQEIPYSVGSWSDALGNHRARIEVAEKADAVRVYLPWRRHDRDLEKHEIRIVEASTGKAAENAVRIVVCGAYAELVFQPESAGEYFVYDSPYEVQKHYGNYTGSYLPVKATASAEWLARNGLSDAQRAQGSWKALWKKLPQARVLEFQSRSELDRLDPMEVTATDEEMRHLLAGHEQPYLVFAEDRKYPIRMRDALPLRWIRSGPVEEFEGEADRNEYYAMQVGVFASRRALEEVQVQSEKLASARGGVLAAPVCLNIDGVDYLGKPFVKKVSVAQGKVQALWLGIDVPRGAAPGLYRGTVTIQPKGLEPTRVKLALKVSDRVREDRGDGEPWRHSRLRWLNSTVGEEDRPVPPYTPLVVRDDTIASMSCQVRLDSTGLPGQIRCGSQDLLSKAMRLVVETAAGAEAIGGGKPKLVKETPGAVGWESRNVAKGLAVECRASMEYDGHIGLRLVCRAGEPMQVEDIRLEIPVRRDAAAYFMGIGCKGGLRPKEWSWKWGGKVYFDSFWIGDVPGGLQCELRGASYCGPMVNLYWPMGQLQPPDSWSNGGRGGCTMAEAGDTVLVRAYTGPRKLEANQPLELELALLPTPVKPLNTAAQFRQRYYHAYEPLEQVARTGANVVNIHHATELNPFINYPFLANDKLRAYVDEAHQRGMKLKIYYTVRELTNRVTEIWALRSLGHEVLAAGQGGGYPWLREHLIDDYAPAWYDYLPNGEVSAALVTTGTSRWLNYYVEGLRWLVENLKIDGLYLDDVSYDRQILKRMHQVMARRPGCLIDLHSNTAFSHQPANQYLEFFPFIDRLWFGESFNYDESPDYWLIEISGIPYGLMGEMLQNGGNRWRGMIYGMTTRLPASGDPRSLWKLWDEFGIAEARMIGYWDRSCPVRTGRSDVLATAYVRRGKSLVAVASWAKEPVQCRLKFAWKSLGLEESKARLEAPAVEGFQPARSFAPGEPIPVEPGRGWLLMVSEGAGR